MTDSDVKNYRDVMFRISSMLEIEEAQNIAILADLEHAYREERQLLIFVQLEQRLIISEDTPEKLYALLRRIGRFDLEVKAKKLTSALQKNKKRKQSKKRAPGQAKSTIRPPDDCWKSAEFALTRMQIEQSMNNLEKLRSEYDKDHMVLADALKKLQLVRRDISKAEKLRGLPTTKNFTDALDDETESSSSSCHSSLGSSSNNSGPDEPEDEVIYAEPLLPCHRSETDQHKTRVDQIASNIDSRPPIPTPRVGPCTQETGTISQHQVVKVPQLGMITTSDVMTTPVRENSLHLRDTKADDDENTGDSGHGTGSGDGCDFVYVQPFLRQPLASKKSQTLNFRTNNETQPVVPIRSLSLRRKPDMSQTLIPTRSKKVAPHVPPKPRSYMTLNRTTATQSSDYTRILRNNGDNQTDRDSYSTAKR